MEISTAILIISGTANLVLGTMIFLRDKKNLINFFYGGTAWGAAMWCLGIYFFRDSLDITLIWSKIAYVSVAIVGIFYLYFSFYFPTKIKIKPFYHLFLISFFLVLVWLIVFTDSILKSHTVVNSVYGLIFGEGYYLYYLYILTFFGLGLINLFIKYFKSSGLSKLQIKYVLIGTFLSISIGAFTNLILFGFGIFNYNWVGPSSLILLVGFIGYAIIRLRLMNIKIILTEALIAIIGFILLLEAVMSTSLSEIIFKFLIFFGFSYVGMLLLKGVYREIHRREEVEKMSKAKSEFISIASHQLRTPLAAIKGYISMVLEGTYGKIDVKAKKPLESVYASNERLLKLVNNLLNVSRIETGRLEMNRESVSIEDLLESIVMELEPEAKERNIYLKFERPNKSLGRISIDEEKLRQVIMNLVDNAIKYTPKGGVTVRALPGLGRVRIEVQDTGEGISQDEVSHIFESFARGKAGNKLWTEGSGLGLYVAKKFVDMHKGRIWMESEGKGKGTTFFVEIPVLIK